jgi:hypothetical protein
MDFNRHSNLSGLHSLLSPSDHAWVNYDEDKMTRVFHQKMTTRRGTELHALAHDLIKLGVKLPDTNQTLNMYVNDAIGYKMSPEVVLKYSDVAFGTADAIGYRRGKLRVHDLKNGVNKASMIQLLIYVALFCLEYGFRPSELEIETRIYQNDAVEIYNPTVVDIAPIMDRIVTFTKLIEQLRAEVE